jgi:MFS family permease
LALVLRLWGLPIALIPLFPREATALILLACVGFGNALVDVGLYTLMARLAPDAVLARLFGLKESLVSLSVGIGAVFASLLIDLTSVSVAMVAIGALCPILVAATWRRLGRPDRDIGDLDKETGLLRGLPMLQPLPLPAIEQLARGLEPVRVPAGQAGFRQGDPADRFYVIETGAADVVGDGHLVTTLGPGDGFGEIALLRRVRRTATVQAATDLELQALTRDRFLPVVTGFPPSSREARAEVEEMLDRFSPGESDDDQHRSGE